MSKEEYDKHIAMQDKIFPDWKKYWTYSRDGQYQLKKPKQLIITSNKI